MYLSEILKRENNNFGLLRLLLAFMVIYGHSNLLMETNHTKNYISFIMGNEFKNTGSRVMSFFFLSGMLITYSLLKKNDVIAFIIARVFRIYPAYIVVILFTALVIGPIFTNLSLHDYLTNSEVTSYIIKNLKLSMQWTLPELFPDNYYPSINSSIWTIPFEIYAYALFLCLYILGVFINKKFATLIACMVVLDTALGTHYIFSWISSDSLPRFIPLAFAFGSLLVLWRDKIKINFQLVIACWVLHYLFKHTLTSLSLAYMALFVTLLFIFSTPLMLKFKPKIDISYGVYLWGYPIQQIIIHFFPKFNSNSLTIAAIIVCTFIGILSWYLIEKPSMNLEKKINLKLKDKKQLT